MMGCLQEELKTLYQSQSFDITGISETWWDVSYDWRALLDSYRLFRRDKQTRKGRDVLQYNGRAGTYESYSC